MVIVLIFGEISLVYQSDDLLHLDKKLFHGYVIRVNNKPGMTNGKHKTSSAYKMLSVKNI